MTTTSQIAKQARRELAPRIAGPLIAPQDDGYDDARAVYNGMIDRRPALIGRCARPEDVAAAIGFARRHELALAVRGGGHHGAGLGLVDDGLVIDLSPMKDIRVDPGARTARVGGGCLWGEVDRGDRRARPRHAQRDRCRPRASAGSRSAAVSAT